MIAAVRGGGKEVLLPIDNESDVEEIPEEVRNAVKITFVRKIDDVFKAVLCAEIQTDRHNIVFDRTSKGAVKTIQPYYGLNEIR